MCQRSRGSFSGWSVALYISCITLYTGHKFFSYSDYASISSCDQRNYPIQPNICLGLNTHHRSTLQKANSSLYSHQQGGNAHLSTPLPELHIIPLKYLAFLWPFKLDLAFLNTGEDEHSHAYWPTVFMWTACSCALHIFPSCYIKFEFRKDSIRLQILPIFYFCFLILLHVWLL